MLLLKLVILLICNFPILLDILMVSNHMIEEYDLFLEHLINISSFYIHCQKQINEFKSKLFEDVQE
jgi:hypothetical protein